MSRALVLGGGGPVGIGWESGLIVGLAEAGIALAEADAIVGTSAGSVVGSQLASGADLAETPSLMGTSTRVSSAEPAVNNDAAVQGLQDLTRMIAESVTSDEAPEVVRARLGTVALNAPTASEEQYLQLFSVIASDVWPSQFSCTGVDTATGEFKLWGHGDNVPLARALAASCSVPTIFPPVTIGSARYMDGGMRDMLNADAANGHDTVVAVSCVLLDVPPGWVDPTVDALLASTREQIEGLREAGSNVALIVPGEEFLDISGFGMFLMDFTRTQAAYDAGLRQAKVEAERIATAWNVSAG